MKITVGSRGSKLAVVQTNWLLDRLRRACPNVTFELKIIRTKGDLIQHKALDAIGDKGIFTKELEDGLLTGNIQMAVHSMKDMPSSLPAGLTLTVPTEREDPSDVLVTPHDIRSLAELPRGAVVGTGSKRRAFQLASLRPDIIVTGIRGNVDTRLRRMTERQLDGIILAAAGMRRMGMYDSVDYHCVSLDPSDFVCAPAQGILAVEIREDNAEVQALMATICDKDTQVQMAAERGFLMALNGDCHLPIGAYCELQREGIILHGLYGDEAGTIVVKGNLSGHRAAAAQIGQELAEKLKEQVDG